MSPYPSSQKGGTLIASEVLDLEMHREWLTSGGYRLERCPCCGAARLHVHDYRSRRVQGGDEPTTKVVRFRCAEKRCGATWQVLPGFIARWLHYNWEVVESHCRGRPRRQAWGRPPSSRTVKRWRARMASSAAPLKSLVSDTVGARLRGRLLTDVSTRMDLAQYLSRAFAKIASWLHELMPGIRLM